MTALLKPFTGLVPSTEFAHRIVGPPSSMLSDEQRWAARRDPLSFRNSVGRGARAPHTQALNWLQECLDLDALRPVEEVVVVHGLRRGDVAATGLLADVSLDAYDGSRVRRHEATIAKTQRKMVDYMRSTRILGNPVALAHRDDATLASTLKRHTQRPADVAFEAADGTHHSLWLVPGAEAHALCDSFRDVLYITDGHHRLAAGSALGAEEERADPHLPASLFAESELKLAAFARVIEDPDLNVGDVLGLLEQRFEFREVDSRIPRPTAAQQVGVRMAGRSFLLTYPASLIPDQAHERLDVSLLQDLILDPIFAITDPRSDERLRFTADSPIAEHDVDGCSAWFLPYPASVHDVMTVADSGRTMPPKSTYFMPKVPSGLIIRPL